MQGMTEHSSQSSYIHSFTRQLHSEKKTRGKNGKNNTNETIFQGTFYRWIHDALYCESIHKIALSSDDHQITIYGKDFRPN